MVIIISLHINSFAQNRARVFIGGFFYPYDYHDKQSAIYGFNKLGYNVSSNTNFSKTSMLNWIGEPSNNYAFYVSTHGPSDSTAAGGYMAIYDHNMNAIRPYEFSGNWHLVYMDACNSKRNNQFVNALHINSASSRAFLGWKTEVSISAAHQFNSLFWRKYVTHHPIRTAAIKAANDVPGAGTTPIRFSGDSSWYGYSH